LVVNRIWGRLRPLSLRPICERGPAALNEAKKPEEMNLPGYRFHGLLGRSKGRYAADARGNWRITFGWDGEYAIDIDLEDYH
jgi:toxin HigB-1